MSVENIASIRSVFAIFKRPDSTLMDQLVRFFTDGQVVHCEIAVLLSTQKLVSYGAIYPQGVVECSIRTEPFYGLFDKIGRPLQKQKALDWVWLDVTKTIQHDKQIRWNNAISWVRRRLGATYRTSAFYSYWFPLVNGLSSSKNNRKRSYICSELVAEALLTHTDLSSRARKAAYDNAQFCKPLSYIVPPAGVDRLSPQGLYEALLADTNVQRLTDAQVIEAVKPDHT